MRGEFDSIEAGFALLPAPSTNANRFVVMNSGGTAMEALTAANARNRLEHAYDFGFLGGYDSLGVQSNLVVQVYGILIVTRPGSLLAGERGSVETAPTGSIIELDLKKNGTTVYTVKPSFAVSTGAFTAGTLKTDGTEDFVAGDVFKFEVTQIGSTVAGKGLTFTTKGQLTG
jgi:hypothetical protein